MRLRMIVSLCAVAATARAQNLVPVPTPNLGAQCDNMDPAPLAEALERAAAALEKQNGTIQIGAHAVPTGEYARKTLRPLAALARQGTAALCAALPRQFDFYRNPGAGAGHFTVYHNPVLRGSRVKKAPYLFPLYKRPAGADAKLSTADILGGKLDGKGLELVWLDSLSEANKLHIEGSASVQLDDGSLLQLSSDGHNGLPYSNVGKMWLAEHELPKEYKGMVGATRRYFHDHPDDLRTYWMRNPHFVFFKVKQGMPASGKFGALIPGRSIAVDPSWIPHGSVVWLRTDQPAITDNKVTGWVSYGRVSVADDTGAAIKGPARVDVFFGTGEYAEAAAEATSRPGEIYVLLAKGH